MFYKSIAIFFSLFLCVCVFISVYVCKIECNKCKEVYVGLTQALNARISLHKSNIKIPKNRKLNVSKHRYECSNRKFKIPVYQTNDYT